LVLVLVLVLVPVLVQVLMVSLVLVQVLVRCWCRCSSRRGKGFGPTSPVVENARGRRTLTAFVPAGSHGMFSQVPGGGVAW